MSKRQFPFSIASFTSTANGSISSSGKKIGVENPATEEIIAEVSSGGKADCAEEGCSGQRSDEVLDEAHGLRSRQDPEEDLHPWRTRADGLARTMTMEQGKPLAEAKGAGCTCGHLRMVRGRRQAILRASDPAEQRREAASHDQASGRCGRRHRALELPDHIAARNVSALAAAVPSCASRPQRCASSACSSASSTRACPRASPIS
ncbi:MAG: hypothetical protein U0791_14050 [Gemmataceae bacterium]